MFDDLSGPDWLVIGSALALGFGLVRYLIAVVEDRSSGLSPKVDAPADRPPEDSSPP